MLTVGEITRGFVTCAGFLILYRPTCGIIRKENKNKDHGVLLLNRLSHTSVGIWFVLLLYSLTIEIYIKTTCGLICKTIPQLMPGMMTPSNGNHISALLALCAGNSPVTGEFPAQRPVTPGTLMFFFDLRLNQQLSKHWRRRWFETPSHSLWRHFNG